MNGSNVNGVSDEFDLNESCIRSDIENIIKKMYNPVAYVSSDHSREDCHQDFLQSSKYTVNKNSTHTFYGGPTTYSDTSDTINKRFGFYFESVRRNDVRTTVVESSTSDSVSIPKTKRKLKRSRLVCDCCKRKISQFNQRRIHYCKICKESNECHPETTSNRLKLEGKKYSKWKGQGDTRLETESKLGELNTCIEQESKDSIQPVLNTLPVSRVSVSTIDKCKQREANTTDLQIVPDLEKGLVEEIECPNGSNFQKPDLKAKSKARSTTIFGRVFSTFSIYLSKSKIPNQADSKLKVDKLNKISEEKETTKHQSSVVSQGSIRRSQLETELLTRQVEILNSSCYVKDDEGRSYKNITRNDSLISTVIDLEPKRSCCSMKYKDKTDRNTLASKPSSIRRAKSSSHQTLIGHNSSRGTTHLGKSEVSRDTLASINTYEPKTFIADVLEESLDSTNVGRFEKSNLCQAEEHSVTEVIKKNQNRATEFWVKTFGSIQIVLEFFTTFVLELLTLVLKGLLYPLLWGTLQVLSDHFFKPCLNAVLKGIIEPVFGFLGEVSKSSSSVFLPVSECFGHFLKQIASLCGTCRIVEIHKTYNKCEDSRNP